MFTKTSIATVILAVSALAFALNTGYGPQILMPSQTEISSSWNPSSSTINVTTSQAPSQNTTFNVTVSDPVRLTAPSTVTIPANSNSGSFTVSAANPNNSQSVANVTVTVIGTNGVQKTTLLEVHP